MTEGNMRASGSNNKLNTKKSPVLSPSGEKKKTAMTSVNVVSIFAKTPPKVTRVTGGFVFDFIDVLSVTKQQEITAKNFDPEDLKKFIEKELNPELKLTDGKHTKEEHAS